MNISSIVKQSLYLGMITVLSSCAHVEKETVATVEQGETNSAYALDDNAYSSLSLMMHVLQLIHENYVDMDEVTYQKLIDDAMKGMVLGLDPYSQYFEPEVYGQVEKENTGQFGGIGVVLRLKDNGLEMMKVNKDGPADKAGVKAGDFITEIDSDPVKGMDFRDCLNHLKGKADTTVEVNVYRKSDDKNHKLLITRKVIKISPIAASHLLVDKIGYVKLSQFTRPTIEKLDEALVDLQNQGMKALIFDLRNNPGGFVDSAVDVCSRFIADDKLVVFTQGRAEEDKTVMNSTYSEVKVLDIPMVILINEMSASASEIVAGCLKDYKRAVLIGAKSYGKGSVQTVVNLSNKGAVKFTIAKYYTPNAYVIHGKGIDPDIKVPIEDKIRKRFFRQLNQFPGELKPKPTDSILDTQLERAIEVLNAVLIYKQSGL